MGIFKKKRQPAGSDRDRRIVAEIYRGLSGESQETPQDIARDILRRHELKYSQPTAPPKRVRVIDLFMPKSR